MLDIIIITIITTKNLFTIIISIFYYFKNYYMMVNCYSQEGIMDDFDYKNYQNQKEGIKEEDYFKNQDVINNNYSSLKIREDILGVINY